MVDVKRVFCIFINVVCILCYLETSLKRIYSCFFLHPNQWINKFTSVPFTALFSSENSHLENETLLDSSAWYVELLVWSIIWIKFRINGLEELDICLSPFSSNILKDNEYNKLYESYRWRIFPAMKMMRIIFQMIKLIDLAYVSCIYDTWNY